MSKLPSEIERIIQARHHDPFAVLGKHLVGEVEVVRALSADVKQVTIMPGNLILERIPETDLFEWRGKPKTVPDRYQLKWEYVNGDTYTVYDPYCFPPQLSDFDLHLFGEGKHWHAYNFLGAHLHTVDKVAGVLFSVWAPNAERVSVVGSFNNWDGRRHSMRVRGGSGVWELFIPDLAPGTL